MFSGLTDVLSGRKLTGQSEEEKEKEVQDIWKAGYQAYGNYCGPGNEMKGQEPIDNLDALCKAHDEGMKNFWDFDDKAMEADEKFLEGTQHIIDTEANPRVPWIFQTGKVNKAKQFNIAIRQVQAYKNFRRLKRQTSNNPERAPPGKRSKKYSFIKHVPIAKKNKKKRWKKKKNYFKFKKSFRRWY